MKRTAEELIALREKRETVDREKTREERRRAANRARRRKLGDGDLLKELGLSPAQLRGLIAELTQNPMTADESFLQWMERLRNRRTESGASNLSAVDAGQLEAAE